MKASSDALTLRKLRIQMDKQTSRKLDYLQEKGVGTWLNAMPSFSCGTTLSATEFIDEIRDRHCLPLLNTPPKCDGCGAKFSMPHCLGYKVGNLVQPRHDENRDSLTHLASEGFSPSNTRDEPSMNKCRDTE